MVESVNYSENPENSSPSVSLKNNARISSGSDVSLPEHTLVSSSEDVSSATVDLSAAVEGPGTAARLSLFSEAGAWSVLSSPTNRVT